MAKHIEKPIKVTTDSDLLRLLDEADSRSPVLLKRRGVVYQLSRVDEIDTIDYEPDPEKVRRVLDETVGSWADLDVDQMIEDIYRWRREGSREPVDP